MLLFRTMLLSCLLLCIPQETSTFFSSSISSYEINHIATQHAAMSITLHIRVHAFMYSSSWTYQINTCPWSLHLKNLHQSFHIFVLKMKFLFCLVACLLILLFPLLYQDLSLFSSYLSSRFWTILNLLNRFQRLNLIYLWTILNRWLCPFIFMIKILPNDKKK